MKTSQYHSSPMTRPKLTKTDREIMREAVAKLNALQDAGDFASRHPGETRHPGPCSVYDRTFARGSSESEGARIAGNTSLYIGSWIEPLLRTVLKRIEGLELTDEEQQLYAYYQRGSY